MSPIDIILTFTSPLNNSLKYGSFAISMTRIKRIIVNDQYSNTINYRSFSESSSKCDSVSPWVNRKRENIPLKVGKLNPVSEPDSTRYVYVENSKGSPRLWKQVEDQELGGNVGLSVVCFIQLYDKYSQ